MCVSEEIRCAGAARSLAPRIDDGMDEDALAAAISDVWPGRKSQFGAPTVIVRFSLPAEFIALARRLYLELNRTKAGGSYALAVRLAANHPCCPPGFKAYLAARPDRQYLPPSVRAEIAVCKALVDHHRAPTGAVLNSVYTPGVLHKHPSEERRLHAGEQFSSDDGSVNFLVQVPWPWGGGDACADKYGVKVGRFQVLPILDCGSGYVPAVSWVVRAAQSYRAEDLVATMGHAMRQTGLWQMAYLERGSWEAERMNEFFRLADIERLTAYLPRQKLIEIWWNTTWTHLSRLPGQIGRFRGEEEEMNRRLTAYREGRRDPRNELLTITQAMAAFQQVIDVRNHDRIDAGPLFGSWVPAERWQTDLAQHPMRPWPAKLDHLLRPERRELMVRRHMISCEAISPLGEKNAYKFFDEALIPLERKYVTAYFDPNRDPVTAAIFHGSELLCSAATCISRAPVIMHRAGSPEPEIAWDGEHAARAEEAKRRARTWVRREHRTIAPDGSLKAWMSEQRGPDGQIATGMEHSTAAAPQTDRVATADPVRHVRTDAELEADDARTSAEERRLVAAGVISVPAY